MLYLYILLLSLLVGYEVIFSVNHKKCRNMDEFKLIVNSNQLKVFYQLKECNNCELIYSKTFNSTDNQLLLDSNYGYYFKVINTETNQILCSKFYYDKFGECGEYELNSDCEIKTLKKPNNIYIHLYMAFRFFIMFIILTNLAEKYNIFTLRQSNQSNRLKSLDTFRGFTLFLMIFVNYGSGGYHQLKHAPWHGITIADFVFPWFLFIMGFSVPISVNSSLKKETTLKLFGKILTRTLKLFTIGIMLNSRYGVELTNLRIFGVLQRLAICYLVVASLELFTFKRIYKNNSISKISLSDLVIVLIVVVWNIIVFYFDVPGCPKGYFGPGGLEQNSKYHNCTGGVTGYLDKVLLGTSHIYSRPTCSRIFKTSEPFDPEGILGTFNSILLTYLGVRAGRIILNSSNKINHVFSWLIWSVGCLFIYYLMTGFNTENEFIPVNKNLWTLTYTLITASSSFILISILYYIIDLKQFWSGNPFNYLGTNSILIYICHCIFNKTLPCQWLVSNTHFAQVLMHLWGSIFWTLVSMYLFKKQIFLNL